MCSPFDSTTLSLSQYLLEPLFSSPDFYAIDILGMDVMCARRFDFIGQGKRSNICMMSSLFDWPMVARQSEQSVKIQVCDV